MIPDLHTSDHYPILIKMSTAAEATKPARFNFRKADWAALKTDCIQNITPDLFINEDEDKMKLFTSKLIELAKKNIPQISRLPRPALDRIFSRILLKLMHPR